MVSASAVVNKKPFSEGFTLWFEMNNFLRRDSKQTQAGLNLLNH